ncbi:protein kinase C-binding protein 1-like isoform X2 [Pectinophora gossypiella]|uniref:protein kinase C-binding protein 1-like isoform X2 n=1 Tax=Pectinophora gossypiella TaxID=13191 RepID=UPI00214E348D|nr:protein kinase C-binding protein 1-like isoform X2 [Pectinophora gossypiella]
MDDNSEAHMDTGVSSTTEDIQEVQEVTGSHRNVETVITVESVKEEDMNPNRNRPVYEAKSTDKGVSNQPVPNTSHPEVTIRRITIKSPLKDVKITKTIQKSPLKSEDIQTPPVKVASKDASSNKTSQPVTEKPENPVDSTSKTETDKSPSKHSDKNTQNNSVNSSEVQKLVQNSPIKDPQLQESTLTKKTEAKQSPVKDQQVPPKEQVANVIVLKEQPTKSSSVKEQVAKTSPSKEQPSKSIPVKESPSKTNLPKELPNKTITIKELPSKVTPAKEILTKPTVIKEQMVKTPTTKESPPKIQSTPLDAEKPIDNSIKMEDTLLQGNKSKTISLIEEASNDSQVETSSDVSEKEHKNISRELRSLINSAKESKIISECTQLTSKTRKSRTPLDTSNTSLNASVEADKIQGVRRGSDNSQKSNSSEKSDKTVAKRSMRSQNPEFVSKVKSFLNSVSGKVQKVENQTGGELSDAEADSNLKDTEKELAPSSAKKRKTDIENEDVADKDKKLRIDPYCWRCHWAVEPSGNEKVHPPLQCSVCPRSFHYKCLSGSERNRIHSEKNWVCPECMMILQAESSETRSPAMKKISLGMLCDLLRHALDRMMEVNGVEPFVHPVDRTSFPDYDKYVVHPMDLTQMRAQINEGLYGSTEAFVADAQWILHNSIIFNTLQAKLTGGARALVRSCRAEMGEIEACPECYAAAHARRPTWFTDVCSTPHVLLWAKLKGFPYWPAKGMSVGSAGLVDVRFFGAHDRAWVPARDCFLYSEKDPNNFRSKRQDILDSMQEAEQHIRNISRKYGKFVYPPFKTQFDPTKLNEQLKMMIPSFEGEVRSPVKDKPGNSPSMDKNKSRSNSKSSKESGNDGQTSEGEDQVPSRKMADGAVIAREEDDFSLDKSKDKAMEVDTPQSKENETSRKRRRSELEEAVITIIDSTREKRKRLERQTDEKKKERDSKDEKQKLSIKEEAKSKEPTAISVESQPSTSVAEKKSSPKVTPIRVISIAKVMRNAKISPKPNLVKDDEKPPSKQKANKVEKSVSTEKEKGTRHEDKKSQKRRNSKNKSLNSSNVGKTDKVAEKKADKTNETPSKDKAKETSTASKSSEPDADKSNTSSLDSSKSSKDRQKFDDNTSLAVIARGAANNGSSGAGLPTISSVRSLSATAQSSPNAAKSTETVVEATSDSSIFTPTSTDNVRNMKEAVNKLQKLKGGNEVSVGRVGVRAFARMTSPPEKELRENNDVEVEIKAEPIDYEDTERQMQEKMDLMNAFKLRPVNPPAGNVNLREVRINKVVVTPMARNQKAAPQPPAVRPRAKKTFPQPKKPEEGRSELTSKNSMVYIPIQPPATQAPPRAARPAAAPAASAAPAAKAASHTPLTNTSTANATSSSNTALVPSASFPSSAGGPIGPSGATGQGVQGVPTTVHTMPLITSVNGQWTFSLQPVLSVGGVDGAPSPPMVNGLADRSPILPIAGSNTSQLVPVPVSAASGGHTPHRASSETSTPREPPRLQQRPALVHPLDPAAPLGNVPAPSTVGPLTAKLNQNAVKIADFFRTLLEDSLEKLDEPAAHLTALKMKLEQVKWQHQQEINEIKHNHELETAEMRSSFEKEKLRLVAEIRRQSQLELDAAVKFAKTKQWCANCSQEAQFYCCWNTSYCDYPCQRAHWAQHYAVCTQQRSDDGDDARLQPPPDSLPKTTAAPNLTAGKLAPSRIYTQEQTTQKPSIIVSMVEDNTGSQAIKCVGSFKPPAGSTQISPLILNKQCSPLQIMNSEEAKKVMTSGGYLIVGATNAAGATSITPARRAPAVQYIS